MSLFKPTFGARVNWSHPLSNGLIACYLMNEGGGPYARDIAKNNTGTLTGFANPSTTTSGWGLNGSLVFDGTDDYINCGSTIALDSSNFTISVWLYPRSFPANTRFVSYYGNGPTIWAASAGVQLVHGGTVDFNCGITLVANKWQHIVVSRVGTTVSAYLNGIRTAQNTSFTTTYTADTSVRLGNSTAYNEPYYGTMDTVRIYNRGINAQEAYQLYTTPYIGINGNIGIIKKVGQLITSTSNFFFGA